MHIVFSLVISFIMTFSYVSDSWAAENFQCYADQAAITGFYAQDVAQEKGDKIKLEHYPLKKQSTGGGYNIQLKDGVAEIFDQVTNDTYQYQIISREGGHIVLMRPKGVGVETITIDESSGSFVQTDVVISLLYNRTAVWVGYCQ